MNHSVALIVSMFPRLIVIVIQEMDLVSGNVNMGGMELLVLSSVVTVVIRKGAFKIMEHACSNVLLGLPTVAVLKVSLFIKL